MSEKHRYTTNSIVYRRLSQHGQDVTTYRAYFSAEMFIFQFESLDKLEMWTEISRPDLLAHLKVESAACKYNIRLGPSSQAQHHQIVL